jgi:hypothetical protein
MAKINFGLRPKSLKRRNQWKVHALVLLFSSETGGPKCSLAELSEAEAKFWLGNDDLWLDARRNNFRSRHALNFNPLK